MPNPIRLVHIGEDRAEATDCGRGRVVGGGRNCAGWDKEHGLGDVAVYRGEQAQRTEGAEDVTVGWIAEEPCKAALRPACWGRLSKACPRSSEPAITGVKEHIT